MISLGCSFLFSSRNCWTNGMFTASKSGVILSVVSTCLSICTARVPAATPP